MNIVDATSQGGTAALNAGGSLPFAVPDGPIKIGMRPEHVLPGEGGDLVLNVCVDVVENLGGTRYIYGTLPSGESMIVEDREKRGGRAGETVPVGIRAEKMLVFSQDGRRLRNLN